MEQHLMIDIETLDTATTAVVTSVGWSVFNSREVLEPIEMAFDIQEQIDRGRTISASTLQFWMRQSEPARQLVFDPLEVHSIADLARRLRHVIDVYGVSDVWSHGPAFDIATLKSLMGEEPWDFRSLRDTRTLARMSPSTPRVRPAIPHSSGSDAQAQAHWARNMMIDLGVFGQ